MENQEEVAQLNTHTRAKHQEIVREGSDAGDQSLHLSPVTPQCAWGVTEDNAVEDLSFNVIDDLELSPVEIATATLPHWSGCSKSQVSIPFICSRVYPHHGRSHHHPACCRCPWAEKGNLRISAAVHKTLT